MNRADALSRLRGQPRTWDLAVIGGGATGVGVALDAAARGYDVALLEQNDFGKGTSSRSTKLIHGGVRYLQQGNIPLVVEALKERGILRTNAPHLVHDLPFVVPNYKWWEAPFYGVGMRVYDVLAGRYGFGTSRNLSLEETLERIPNLEDDGLRGGVMYHDGQFDDARLLMALARTAHGQGAALLNYAPVTALLKDESGFVSGVVWHDAETGHAGELRARVVVNATGVFTDDVRRMDAPDAKPVVRPSQGVHIVLDRSFLSGDAAIMVPHTDDGRVLFAIPWLDRVLVGTTDTPLDEPSLEPRALAEEVDFLLEHARRYMERDPQREDVLSVFAGLRPLVAPENEEDTAEISREHAVRVSDSGLLTIAGGKWTTYRKMAEDTVDVAQTLGDLEARPCVTRTLNIQGFHQHAEKFGRLAPFGSDAPEVQALVDGEPDGNELLHPRLDFRAGEVTWFARTEMARTVDDVLARRTRALLMDARAAREAAPAVARILARELGRDPAWVTDQVEEFQTLADGYLLP
ncbi:MAG TPA: glycerol-3-phosphate dehydrogenase/oxidase [Longimicrobiales bacterium]|nr:glycerol-3-phosphate dehydrogenase/oxidase [Longimicrobiales bacterium]